MSAPKTFKENYLDFQISLQVNQADILEIQALNTKTNGVYSFSIDNHYLHEHFRFANIFETPVQLFQYLKENFKNVVFSEEQIQFTYSGISPSPRKITILLFEENAFNTFQTILKYQKDKATKIIDSKHQANDLLIKEIKQTTDNLNVQVKQLQKQTDHIQKQIDKIKK